MSDQGRQEPSVAAAPPAQDEWPLMNAPELHRLLMAGVTSFDKTIVVALIAEVERLQLKLTALRVSAPRQEPETSVYHLRSLLAYQAPETALQVSGSKEAAPRKDADHRAIERGGPDLPSSLNQLGDIYHDPASILAEMNRIRETGIDSDPEAPLAENAGYLFTVIENLTELASRSSSPTEDRKPSPTSSSEDPSSGGDDPPLRRSERGFVSPGLVVCLLGLVLTGAWAMLLQYTIDDGELRLHSFTESTEAPKRLRALISESIDEVDGAGDGQFELSPAPLHSLRKIGNLKLGATEWIVTHGRDNLFRSANADFALFDFKNRCRRTHQANSHVCRIEDTEINIDDVEHALRRLAIGRIPVREVHPLLMSQFKMPVCLLYLVPDRFKSSSTEISSYRSKERQEVVRRSLRPQNGYETAAYVFRFLVGTVLVVYGLALVYRAEEGRNRGKVIGFTLTLAGFLLLA